MDYGKDVVIDESALDVEWVNQASLALKYGRHWAECAQTRQTAEENIKLIRAGLIKEVTDDPEECLPKGTKPTGPVIEAYYRTHERHIEAKKDWIQAQYDENVADIARKEIGVTRKTALQNLVTLHGQSYFAGPSIPRDLSFEAANKKKQKDANKKVKLKRKK